MTTQRFKRQWRWVERECQSRSKVYSGQSLKRWARYISGGQSEWCQHARLWLARKGLA